MGQGALSKAVKPALVGLILLAFGLGGWLISDGFKLERVHQQQTYARANDYAARAKVAVERRCRPLPASEELRCIREENKVAREGVYNENELKTQLVTSVWTRQMGIAAIIAMAFGIFGVGLVFVTFHATREGNEIAREAMEGQLRPWVTFTVSQNAKLWVEDDSLELNAEVTFKNIGTSPAIDLTYMGTMVFGSDVRTHFDNLVRHFHTGDTDWADKTLFPDGTWDRTVVAVHSGERKGVHEITFVVIARYRTPFSNKYRFTARAFDVGLTKRNSYGEYTPIGHRNIDIGVLEREVVRLIEKQHFSGFTS